MNHELPKSVRKALAKRMPDDVHPTADTLTAFAERSLPQPEMLRITDHLAQCVACRDVVFLASDAEEETVAGEHQQLVAAAAGSRAPRPVLATAERPQAAAMPASSTDWPGRRGWKWGWGWGSAIAAVLVISGILVLKRSESPTASKLMNASPAPLTAPQAVSREPSVTASPEVGTELSVSSKPKAPERKEPANPQIAKSFQPRNTEDLSSRLTYSATEKPPPSVMPAPSQKQSNPRSLDALGGATATIAASVPMQNSFAGSESQSTATMFGRPQALPSVASPRTQWRVNSDGHLERSAVPGTWTPVLADQGVSFHVVAVVSNDVWAGGSHGALYHSADRGETWSKQSLNAFAGPEGATIISIHFSDGQHGVVTTDDGLRWTTSDGGNTWTKE